MNEELEKIAGVYAPVYENDQFGNLYLDLTGTTKIFGPAADCASRILREMLERIGIRPATAVAGNKLVGKIATRTIRPTGLIQVQAGTEADFLVHQDLQLLPGVGLGLLRTAAATGLREIGELAALTDGEALSLFRKYGRRLRDTARGIDDSPLAGCFWVDRAYPFLIEAPAGSYENFRRHKTVYTMLMLSIQCTRRPQDKRIDFEIPLILKNSLKKQQGKT
jgi:DNA polymerase-4